MGGTESILTMAALSAVNAAFDAVGQGAAAKQQAAAAGAAQAQAEDEWRRQEALRKADEASKERAMERDRKKRLAEARVRMGASGISSAGGSGAALLRGLNGEYDRGIEDMRGQSALTSAMTKPRNYLRGRSGFGVGQAAALGFARSLSDSLINRMGKT